MNFSRSFVFFRGFRGSSFWWLRKLVVRLLAACPLNRYTVIPFISCGVQGAFVFFVFFVVKKSWWFVLAFSVQLVLRTFNLPFGRSIACGVQGNTLLAAYPLYRYTATPLNR